MQALYEEMAAADGRSRKTPFPFSNVRGTTEAGADRALDAERPSLDAFCAARIEVAASMTASSGVNVRGREGAKPGCGVGGATWPSSAAAGVAKPMAQSAITMTTRRTNLFFFMDQRGRGGLAEIATGRVGTRAGGSPDLFPSAAHGRVVRSVIRRLCTGLTTHQWVGRPVGDRARRTSRLARPCVTRHQVSALCVDRTDP